MKWERKNSPLQNDWLFCLWGGGDNQVFAVYWLHILPCGFPVQIYDFFLIFNNFFLLLWLHLDKFTLLVEVLDEGTVELAVGEGLCVAYYYKFHACARDCDIHAAQVAQETDGTFGIVTHQGDDYHVAFLALESIDGANGDMSFQFAEIVLHFEQAPD